MALSPDSFFSRGRLMAHKPHRLLEIPAVLVILVITAIRAISSSDLVLYDETSYLRQGLAIRDGVFPSFTSGATYADFYYVLSLLSSEPIGLYFAGRATSAVLLVLAVWICARLLAGVPLGWVAAAAIAATPVPYVWPGVSAPATGLLLVAVTLAVRFPGTVAIGAGAALVWIAAGSRPELVWVAVTWSAAALILLIREALLRNGPLRNPIIATVLGSFVVPLVLATVHGSPFRSGGREWVAFSQHYSLRNASDGLDPWVDSGAIVSKDFGEAQSVTEAISVNPTAFIGHMVGNLVDTPRVVAMNLWGFGQRDVTSLLGALMIFLILAAALATLLLHRKAAMHGIRSGLSRIRDVPHLVTLSLIIVLLAVTLAATAVIYPRDHYLIFVASLIVLVATWVVSALARSGRLISVVTLLSIILFSLVSLNAARGVITRMAYPAPLAASAIYLIENPAEWRMLGGGQGFTAYVPRLHETSDASPLPGESFAEMLDRLGINVVLTGSTEVAPWSDVPGFEQFAEEPGDFGFRTLYPGSQLVIKD